MNFRDHFPALAASDAIYFNAASVGPHPQRAIDVAVQWAQWRAEPQKIGVPELVGAAANARAHFAAMTGADVEEIALMPNTTYGLNLAARGLPLRPGTILTFDGEFPSCVYPFMALSSRGIELERIPRTPEGLPDEDLLIETIARGDVRAVVVSWVQFATGYVADLARIGAACRAADAFFIVDGIQGCGVRELDLHALPVDIFASGAQKWMCSPWGTGFVYVRRELHDVVHAPDVGWACMTSSEDYSRLTDYRYEFLPDARRFEIVTLAYQDFAIANATLDVMRECGGPAAMQAVIESHAAALSDWVDAQPGWRLVTPRDPARRAGVVSFVPTDLDGTVKRLKAVGVVFVAREGMVRLAPHAYNVAEEVERVTGL